MDFPMFRRKPSPATIRAPLITALVLALITLKLASAWQSSRAERMGGRGREIAIQVIRQETGAGGPRSVVLSAEWAIKKRMEVKQKRRRC